MRKILALVMIIFIAISLSGCDALQRKFTRKKKETKPVPRLYQLKKYDIKPSVELYGKHYAYWQSWMSELIQDLGQNHKHDVRCADEALSQLHDMRNILVPAKADALTKRIRKIEEIRDTIKKENLDKFNSNQVLAALEHEDRVVRRDFDVTRVKKYIRESFDEPLPVDEEKGIVEPAGAAASAAK